MTLQMRDQMNIEKGFIKGRSQGEARVNQLNVLLMQAGRMDDLLRSISDKPFQQKLMAELLPEETDTGFFIQEEDSEYQS